MSAISVAGGRDAGAGAARRGAIDPARTVRPPLLTLGGAVMRRRAATFPLVWALAILQLLVWLFALTFVAMGVLCIAAVDLLVWLELGAVAGALHLAVAAAVMLRRSARLTSGAIAP